MAYLEGEKSQRTYKLNRNATVTVKSEMTGDVYKHKVILEIEQASMEPLRFISKGDIAKLIEDADLEDPQTDLFPESESLVDPPAPAKNYKRRTGVK